MKMLQTYTYAVGIPVVGGAVVVVRVNSAESRTWWRHSRADDASVRGALTLTLRCVCPVHIWWKSWLNEEYFVKESWSLAPNKQRQIPSNAIPCLCDKVTAE